MWTLLHQRRKNYGRIKSLLSAEGWQKAARIFCKCHIAKCCTALRCSGPWVWWVGGAPPCRPQNCSNTQRWLRDTREQGTEQRLQILYLHCKIFRALVAALSIYLPSLLCSRLTRTQLPLLVLVGCSSWELGWEPSNICNQLLMATLSTLSRRNNTSSLRLQTHLTTRYFPLLTFKCRQCSYLSKSCDLSYLFVSTWE